MEAMKKFNERKEKHRWRKHKLQDEATLAGDQIGWRPQMIWYPEVGRIDSFWGIDDDDNLMQMHIWIVCSSRI